MRRFTFAILILPLLLTSVSFGQSKKFRWSAGMCEFEGTFNTKKYSATQLKDTAKLIGDNLGLDTSAGTVWKFDEIKSLNFEPVEARYQQKVKELKGLKIVIVPFWEERRTQLLRELEQYYFLIKFTMASYTDPKALLGYKYADSCIAKYAQPLIDGGNPLFKVWEEVNVKSRRTNASPERIKKLFDEQRKSAEAENFARIEVTAFGWWNCANALVDQGVDYSIREKNFKKLFIRVRTISCETP